MKIIVKFYPRQHEFAGHILKEVCKEINLHPGYIQSCLPSFPQEYGELESLYEIVFKKNTPDELRKQFFKALRKHSTVDYAETS